MTKIFSKMIGVNSPDKPEKSKVICGYYTHCVDKHEATFLILNGTARFQHCGC